MRSLLISSTALCAFLPACALAQTAPVEELVVTATRLPTRPELVTGAHVIDRVELEARGSMFATDVLATVPGVNITRNGAFGGVGAIRIRGASGDKTLVLIDGVPQNDAADPNGTFDPGSLQLADIDRIEVLSGPQGSLWGSDAIGGVVAFTTRELSGWRVEGEGGSFKTARGFAGVGVSEDRYAVAASVAGFRTDGISKAEVGTEKDGFKTVTANLGGRLTLNDDVQFDGRVRYTNSDIDIDGYPAPSYEIGDTADRNKSRAWSGFGRATVQALGLTHRLSISDYDIDRRNISDFSSRYKADRQVYRWTADRKGLAFGVERENTHADLDGRPNQNLSTTSAFVVGQHSFERLTLTGSARYDDPDAFKGRFTGRLSAAVEAGRGFTVTVSAGQGFKTPTISQVVCDFCYSPPEPLKPEKADGYDLRVGWVSPDGRISGALTGYRLSVKEQISYGAAGHYINIANARSTGLEAEADVLLTDAWRVKLAYALIDAIDVDANKSLLRTPDRSGAVSVFWTEGKWDAALTVRGESSQSDTQQDGFSIGVRKGFVVADLAGSWKVTDRFALTARLENLSDERYNEVFGYGEPGRALYVGFRIRN